MLKKQKFPPNFSLLPRDDHLLKNFWDFPGGPVVKYPPANAGDMGSIPGQGTKIPHAAEQLSRCAATTEPMRLNQRAHVPQTTEPINK